MAILDGGFWFWFNVIYSYVLILIGFVILLNLFIRSTRLYRRQTGEEFLIVFPGASLQDAGQRVRAFAKTLSL